MGTKTRASVVLGLSGTLLLVSAGLTGAYFLDVRQAGAATSGSARPADAPERTDVPEEIDRADLDPEVRAAVVAATESFLDAEVELAFGDSSEAFTWRELGVVVDPDSVDREAYRFGARGERPDPAAYDAPISGRAMVPVKVDRERALERLLALKKRHDKAPTNARLDLENQKVNEAVAGWGIDVYGSMSAVELAARKGASSVELEGAEIAPARTVENLGIADISSVLGTFTTRFSVSNTPRNSNLKLAASRLDGHVLQPGEKFSFNDVVGDRTEKEGYRIAHVITAGQMVDGLAGGTCQISTTLHGAAFFAGLDILRSLPHSRPSTYVQMGLDATVVYPYVDLKLRNPYEFPVAIRYKVARGVAKVEILGEKRPYDAIKFVREIEKELEFETVTREDAEMPVGSMVVDQHGFPGYKLKRLRKYYRDGKLVKQDKWNLRYRPVTEYVRMGVNPNPNLEPPEPSKPHGPRPPRRKRYSLVQ